MSSVLEIASSTDYTSEQQQLVNMVTTSLSTTKAITSKEELLLTEDVDSQEETEDESDEVSKGIVTRYECKASLY